MPVMQDILTFGRAGMAFLAALVTSPAPGSFLPTSSAALCACTQVRLLCLQAQCCKEALAVPERNSLASPQESLSD